MSVALPQSTATTAQWQVVDWVDRSWASTPAGTDGLATLTLPTLDYSQRWQLTHVVVSCTSTTPTTLRLYLDGVAVGNLRDGSAAGNFDVADWAMGLMVPPSRGLVAQWAGCSPGAVGTLNLQANVYKLAGS